ncbi:serine/threonine-protein kinase PLK1 [Ixodes scapularis]
MRMRTTGTRCRSTRRRRSSRPSRSASWGSSIIKKRLSHSTVFCDLNASENTAFDCNHIYEHRNTVQLYDREYFEGIELKAQKKEQFKFYGELLKRRCTQAEKDQEVLRLKKVKRKEKPNEDDRHWSQKSLVGDAGAGWRIFCNPPADPEEATAASAACQRNRDHLLGDLLKQLQDLVAARPQERKFTLDDDAEDPASVPVFWVSKWVDYTDKYGLGYQLCDNSIGVLFNDNTRIILLNNQKSVTYVDDQCIENYYAMDGYPATLEKKMTLLRYFSDYMKQFLLKAGESVAPREVDDLVRLPCLGSWFRTHSAIVLYLTNGTVQLNFFQDHTKIILCPLMGAVSYIDQKKTFRTYRLETLQKMGCPEELFSRLKYAKGMVERLAREQ